MDSHSRGQYLNAVQWPLASMAAVFLSLRIYCKLSRGRRLWWDDYILIAAWLSCLVFCSMFSAAIHLGYGHHLDYILATTPQNLGILHEFTDVGFVFAVLAAIWSKSSFAVTLLRISEGWMIPVLWFIIISMNVIMDASIVMEFIQCKPVEKVFNPFVEGDCWSPAIFTNYSVLCAVYSGFMDILLAILPWRIIMRTQMNIREKLGVALAMSMGFFAAVFAIVKAVKVLTLESEDATYDSVMLSVWGVAEIAVTITAASIPTLRALLRETLHTTTYLSNPYPRSSPRGPVPSSLATKSRAATVSKTIDSSRSDEFGDRVEILRAQQNPAPPAREGIVKTEEVEVNYGTRWYEGGGTDSDDVEMQRFHDRRD